MGIKNIPRANRVARRTALTEIPSRDLGIIVGSTSTSRRRAEWSVTGVVGLARALPGIDGTKADQPSASEREGFSVRGAKSTDSNPHNPSKMLPPILRDDT